MQWGKSKVEEALAPDSARVHPLSLESVWVITGGNQRARIRSALPQSSDVSGAR